MFAKHATKEAAEAVYEFERELAVTVKRIRNDRIPDVRDLKFLLDKRITNEMYMKYKIEEVCRNVLARNHEDNMGVSNATHEILARITKPKWMAKVARREEPQKMSAAKKDAIMMKQIMKKHKDREAEEREKADAENRKMEEKQKPTITNAERRRRVLERMTREAEERKERLRKRKMEQNQDETPVKKPLIEVITID